MWVGGSVAGALGAASLAVLFAARAISSGADAATPFRLAAFPFLGAAVNEPRLAPWVAVLGLYIHLTLGMTFGTLFGRVFYGVSRVGTLVAGVVYGPAVWLAMRFAILPLLGLGALVQNLATEQCFTEHLLFGVITAAWYLLFQRPIGRAELNELAAGVHLRRR